MKEALELLKEDLGPDAVILDHRKVMLPDGKHVFEVRAATDNVDRMALAEKNNFPALSADTGELKRELEEIKDFLSLLVSTKQTFAELQRHRNLSELYHYLLMQELDEKKIYLFLTRAVKLLNGRLEDRGKLVTAFCQQLLKYIKVIQPLSNLTAEKIDKTDEVWAFVGPTGAGKTTTLAKLAARLKRDRGYRVGIVSLDTYRVGAYDQIKSYADIMGLPLMVAQSGEELNFARRQLRDCDILLIDTMGRNYMNKKHVDELLKCFEGGGRIKYFLVLSANMKDKDMMKLIAQFGPFEPCGLIFTKLDETVTYGNMVNQLLRYPYPLAFLCAGQRVPEDIEEANKRQIVKLLFPGSQGKLSGKGVA
ncbi:hypothetical protein [Thermodesulforhabdus norvegica]|uniref:Flagellar biosynthesis protein FlhF n=1 Tax=Thermodesulforhabdus norvegica TaxID=39841 RepID=A0A1I4R667_9BACT|nr:hypothetical protein [Thermodesulforhabdus norvegica]SFM47403.1 flagellar biosynthesis protein FlhF [Thermodesulforhabdus norvegica]